SAGVVNGRKGNFDVSVVSNGPVTAGGDIRSTGGWIISRHGRGWMDESHGGGFYMTDNEWIRSLNNKSIYTGGQLKGGSVRSDSDLSAGGVLKLDQTNYAGTWCPQTGAISHDSSGGILSCQSGIWRTSKNGWSSVRRFTLYPKNSIDLGRFKLCINSYRIDGREMAETEVVPTDEPDINGEMNWRATNRTQYQYYFMGITCFN
ncbi:shufflon system plasmid conjugative transfer pilus tip adhesin PilV, partial [Salmonella enterica]|nr:shufflon system plasmid conjugative transfer pilus tip adhesin PilV [Salmonella enterica]EEI4535159.1 shufflon system plasmid conjugative transfer pilus tip adhesin PilV [Salmonella enterica]EJP3912890.1 shufflon system plasmid conjugative transfer pilus tip adhesin PilV [Salmonella enterica]